jgi:hypothetical protein
MGTGCTRVARVPSGEQGATGGEHGPATGLGRTWVGF